MMPIRQIALWGGLGAVLLLRWLDPMGGTNQDDTQPEAAAIERSTTAAPPAVNTQGSDSVHNGLPLWPLPRSTDPQQDNDLFASRALMTMQAEASRRPPPPPPAPMLDAPPLPSPPTEPPPPQLAIIGTWGQPGNLALFLAGPQGTVLVRQGDAVMTEYKVQSITQQALTLMHQTTQKTWQIPVPAAPSALTTWPGR